MRRMPATRMNLLRARRRLGQVTKGTGLLRRKREALVTELFRLARRAVDTRVQIGQLAAKAYPDLLDALATHGSAGLRVLGWPTRSIEVDIRSSQVWGIPVADIVKRAQLRRTIAARAAAPSMTAAAVDAAARFEELIEAVLDAAAREAMIRRLGEAVSHTSRQVHMLERRVAPRLTDQIRSVQSVLDEREREERLRLKHMLRRRGRAGRAQTGR